MPVKKTYSAEFIELISGGAPLTFRARLKMLEPHGFIKAPAGDVVCTSQVLLVDFEHGRLETKNSIYLFTNCG